MGRLSTTSGSAITGHETVGVPGEGNLATFWLDVQYSRLAPALAAAGVATVLVKGPAFDQLLFDGSRSRRYSDVDLLVDPARAAEPERVLEQLGFRPAGRESRARRLGRRGLIAMRVLEAPHATAWIRERDGFTIDLHRNLPEVGASAAVVWRALNPHLTTIDVVGTEALTLDRPASALLVALHAAHHGPGWARARQDLRRACKLLDLECWRAAARLADKLEAEAAMGIGLGLTAEGRTLARELGLRTTPTAAHRIRWLWTRRAGRRTGG